MSTSVASAAARNYTRFTELAQRWPVDTRKSGGRCLAAAVRTQIASVYPTDRPEVGALVLRVCTMCVPGLATAHNV
jgi:hypothetical protein